jgi:hypothetical protein
MGTCPKTPTSANQLTACHDQKAAKFPKWKQKPNVDTLVSAWRASAPVPLTERTASERWEIGHFFGQMMSTLSKKRFDPAIAVIR